MSRFVSRRAARLPVGLILGAIIAFPLGVMASHQFGDVPDTYPFHGDITAIANAGVTSGCGGGDYCPDRFVTRGEMAAFMNRLGALAANKTPVVNADKLDGYHASDLNRVGADRRDSLISGSATTGSLSTVITVDKPAALIIVGNASVSSLSSTTGAYGVCDLHVNDGSSLTGSYQQVYNSTNANWVAPCTTQAHFIACSPGAYTVDMDVQVSSSAVDVTGATLIVEVAGFYPTGQPFCTEP